MKFLVRFYAVSLMVFFGQPSLAQDLALSVNVSGVTHEFSLEELNAMPQQNFETTTIWTDGAMRYQGVSLSDVLAAAEANGTTLRMVALNDYAVEMPMDEVGEVYPIVATKMNGATIAVRDKGPYWVVYPYDSDPKYQTETTFARSIWQLKTLSVLE